MTELNPYPSLVPSVSGEPVDDSTDLVLGLTLESWVKITVLGFLFCAVYWLVLRWLWDKTNPIYGEANWGHAVCIPIVGLYYLYINREGLLRQPVKTTWTMAKS